MKCAFESIQTLFEGNVRESCLSLETAGKLMTVLLSCKPRESIAVDSEAQERDSETLLAWLECMNAGVGYLTNLASENQFTGSNLSASHVAVEHMGHLITSALNIIVSSHLPTLRDFVKRIFVTRISKQLVRMPVFTITGRMRRFLIRQYRDFIHWGPKLAS